METKQEDTKLKAKQTETASHGTKPVGDGSHENFMTVPPVKSVKDTQQPGHSASFTISSDVSVEDNSLTSAHQFGTYPESKMHPYIQQDSQQNSGESVSSVPGECTCKCHVQSPTQFIHFHGPVSAMQLGNYSTLHAGPTQNIPQQQEQGDDTGLMFPIEDIKASGQSTKCPSRSATGIPESQPPTCITYTSKERQSIQESVAEPGSEEPSRTATTVLPSIRKCRRHLKEVYRIRFEKYTAVTLYQKHELEMNVYVSLKFRDVNKAICKQVDIPQDQLDLSTDQRIVIYGGSGQGKTTFSQNIVHIWSKESDRQTDTDTKDTSNKLKKFYLVFYLEGKRIESGMSIMGAVFDQLLPDANILGIDRTELEKWVQENQEKVCFIFDALDEVPSTDHALSKFINREYLVKTHAIFTAQNLPVIRCQKYYGVCDFVEGDVSQYIQLFFQKDQGKAKGLQEQLQSNCNLRCIMSNPLFCLLMCVHWKYKEDESKPATETELFKNIFDLSMRKYRQTHDVSETQLKQRCFVNYSLAWKGTRAGKLTFSEDDIVKELKDERIEGSVTVKDVVGLGFLVKVLGHSEEGLIYSFTHIMFQQLLAAMYVKEVDDDDTYDKCWFVGKVKNSDKVWKMSVFSLQVCWEIKQLHSLMHLVGNTKH
ncbi:uncharacterized protein [Ptychodera flava]|uniref:uncharacterized protein isoform X2 n=1 Tax=Ptychodera flava TaxID=63121 RepID=UPI00396A7C22